MNKQTNKNEVKKMEFKQDNEGYWFLDCKYKIYIIEYSDSRFNVERYLKSYEPTLVEWECITLDRYPTMCNADEEMNESVTLSTLEEAKAYALKYYNELIKLTKEGK